MAGRPANWRFGGFVAFIPMEPNRWEDPNCRRRVKLNAAGSVETGGVISFGLLVLTACAWRCNAMMPPNDPHDIQKDQRATPTYRMVVRNAKEWYKRYTSYCSGVHMLTIRPRPLTDLVTIALRVVGTIRVVAPITNLLPTARIERVRP